MMSSVKNLATLVSIASLIFISQIHQITARERYSIFDADECFTVDGYTSSLRADIKSYKDKVDAIIGLVLNGSEHHSTYNELAYFCDTFGPRMSGSKALDDAIAFMETQMGARNRFAIKHEPAKIPKWTIGKQRAELITSTRRHNMTIMTLGYSVGTNGSIIEAPIIMVNSFDQLEEFGSKGLIKGKVVVFNYKFTSYGESVKYRSSGASRSRKWGAVAALIRSVTPYSIYSPHTGGASISIPTAAIPLEDADLMQRLLDRNESLSVKIYIEARNHPPVDSKNLVADIEGWDKPEQVVLVSGHIDSWYNTDGAMDDAGGMMIAYKAIDVLQKLKLKARRTVRAILWVAEEFGLIGAQQYFNNHKHELHNFKVVMESDEGTFRPLGLGYINASPLLKCILSDILALVGPEIGTTKLSNKYEGSDIELFSDQGVVGLSLLNENSKYFYYHHSSGDSMSLENPDELDRSTILWAVTSYILADLKVDSYKPYTPTAV